MKKVSEVLGREMPINGEFLYHLISRETTEEGDDLLAHALSNVDALADALESLLHEFDELADTAELTESEVMAYSALTAYRGYK